MVVTYQVAAAITHSSSFHCVIVGGSTGVLWITSKHGRVHRAPVTRRSHHGSRPPQVSLSLVFALYQSLNKHNISPHATCAFLSFLPSLQYSGGHLTHGFFSVRKDKSVNKVSATSRFFESMPYKIDPVRSSQRPPPTLLLHCTYPCFCFPNNIGHGHDRL